MKMSYKKEGTYQQMQLFISFGVSWEVANLNNWTNMEKFGEDDNG
jgi:hypothetical protein